jgi:hypothetical protein
LTLTFELARLSAMYFHTFALIARTYGLHMGLDVAAGPDDPVIYVVFGSQWLRP